MSSRLCATKGPDRNRRSWRRSQTGLHVDCRRDTLPPFAGYRIRTSAGAGRASPAPTGRSGDPAAGRSGMRASAGTPAAGRPGRVIDCHVSSCSACTDLICCYLPGHSGVRATFQPPSRHGLSCFVMFCMHGPHMLLSFQAWCPSSGPGVPVFCRGLPSCRLRHGYSFPLPFRSLRPDPVSRVMRARARAQGRAFRAGASANGSGLQSPLRPAPCRGAAAGNQAISGNNTRGRGLEPIATVSLCVTPAGAKRRAGVQSAEMFTGLRRSCWVPDQPRIGVRGRLLARRPGLRERVIGSCPQPLV